MKALDRVDVLLVSIPEVPQGFGGEGTGSSSDYATYGIENIAWPNLRIDRMLAAMSTVLFMNNARCIVNLIFSGLLDRYPRQKFVSVESGIGYIPFLLESCEYQMDENTIDQAGLELRPRDYFARQIYASYWFEKEHTDWAIGAIGEDNIMFETDFPHPTCLYPDVRTHVAASLSGVDAAVQRKVLYENAARVYGLPIT